MAHAFGPVIVQQAAGRHSASVLLLHGLGDTGQGWAPVGPQLALPHVRFIYPTAPTRPITVNAGMRMPGWFDIAHLDSRSLEDMLVKGKSMDPAGVAAAVAHVNQLVAKEIAGGVPADRIVVGGFSQGGHVALKAALQHSPSLAGCAAMSTWLEPSKLDIPKGNLNMPIFYGHGSADPLIPAAIASASLEVLRSHGCSQVDFHMYPGMAHSTCAAEMRELRDFLLRVLPPTPEAPLTAEAVRAMSGRELKELLRSRGLDPRGLLEKHELVERALSLL